VEKLRTLVVDDEPGMRAGIRKALDRFEFKISGIDETYGFEVELAENGAQAIDRLEKSRPDILLLDYKLPDTTGLEILGRYRSDVSEMITIMITAYASLETAVSAIKQGAFDFLAKPFTPDELKKTLSKAAQNLILARQVKKLALEKQQVRFQFISVLGHELKSPLNAVEGYIHMIKDGTLGTDVGEYGAIFDRTLIRIRGMRKIINDLLDLTRIESGTKKRDLAVRDLCDIARTAMETVLPDAAARNITVELAAEGPVRIACDSGEIEMIFNNLVSNAVKYNRDSGRVDISLSGRDGRAILSVRDTGIGMAPGEAAELFREFHRVKNEKTKNVTGSGLGLTIVKKLAALYNGEVSVETEPDAGSSFTVTLNPSPDR
jgi:two-component system, sensor histidine kinase and response regulator